MEFVHSATAQRAATRGATASAANATSAAAGTAGLRAEPAVSPAHCASVGEQAHHLSAAGTSPGTPAVPAPHAAESADNEGDQRVWRVQCGDLISRGRCVTVFVENGEVVLIGPPGETARLTATQLGQLRAALDEAAELAER